MVGFRCIIVNTLHEGNNNNDDSDDDDDDDDDNNNNIYCPKQRSPAQTKHKLYQFCMVVKRNEYKHYI